jgi:YafQ family addiction module toxin component
MTFKLEITKSFEQSYKKMSKKDKETKQAIDKKVKQIIENPFRFKPLRKPLQGFRRAHIMKSFVLVYSIKEKEKIITLNEFSHHDNVYK